MVARPRVALLHGNSQFSRRVANSLARLGYEVYRAIGRPDGLPLIYEVRPDLILLDAANAPASTFETVSSIRLMTDVPILLLASHALNPSDPVVAACSQVLTPPLGASKIGAAIRASLKSSHSLATKLASPPDQASIASTDDWNIPRQLVWLQILLPRIRNAEVPEEAIYQVILKNVLGTLHADWVALYLPDPTFARGVKVISRQEVGAGEWTEAQRQFMDAHVAEAVKSQHVVFQARPATGSELRSGRKPHPQGFGEVVLVPFVGRDQVHGVLAAVNRDLPDKHFGPGLIRFMTTTGEALASAMDSRPAIRAGSATASLDGVTGLYNQAFAKRVISTERQSSLRFGRQFSVIQLKWKNREQYSQERGNNEYLHMLRRVADLCQRNVRASDVVARCLDESIAFVLPETDAPMAQHVAARLEQTLEAGLADLAPEARPQLVARVLVRPEATLFEGSEDESGSPLCTGLHQVPDK